MSFKTIFIIVISVMVTIILMNNTDEIDFWIFGNARIPKLAVLGSMFGIGLIVGFMVGRPKPKAINVHEEADRYPTSDNSGENELSDEDREYIK